MNSIFSWPIFGDIYFPDNFLKTVESKNNLQLQKLLSLVVFSFVLYQPVSMLYLQNIFETFLTIF